MSLQEYEKLETLYSNQSAQVSVFKAKHIASGQSVVIKEQGHSDLKGANSAIRETVNQANLSHENICKVYECFIEQVQGTNEFISVIVVEQMQGDLMTEITRRKGNLDYWPEQELLWHMRNLASACAFAQQKNIAHRDIKPPNIFLASDGTLKLGDFGSSSESLALHTATLQGSPLFLSPELKEKFVTTMSYGSEDTKLYDPFQSDVYSLGLTFLYMTLLAPPVTLMSLADLEQHTTELLTEIAGYQTVQYVIQCMLVIDPIQRCTFQQVYDYISDRLGLGQSQNQGLGSSTGNGNVYGVETMSVPVQDESLGISILSGSGISATLPNSEYAGSVFDSRVTPVYFQTVSPTEVVRPVSPVLAERTRICMCCGNEVRDRSWQTSILPEETFPDICSKQCLSLLASLQDKRDHTPHRTSAENTCLYCGAEIKLNKFRILLPCSHGFESNTCFIRFIAHTYFPDKRSFPSKCPRCQEPIDREHLLQLSGGQDKLYQGLMKEANRCAHCKRREADKSLPCRHRLCLSCFQGNRCICPLCPPKSQLGSH